MCQWWTACGGVSTELRIIYIVIWYVSQDNFACCCPSCLLSQILFCDEGIACWHFCSYIATYSYILSYCYWESQWWFTWCVTWTLFYQIDDMIERQCHKVASSVDAGLFMYCINKFLQSVAISSDHQLQPGSCFHSESPVRNGPAIFSLKRSLMKKCTTSYSILIVSRGQILVRAGHYRLQYKCSISNNALHEIGSGHARL